MDQPSGQALAVSCLIPQQLKSRRRRRVLKIHSKSSWSYGEVSSSPGVAYEVGFLAGATPKMSIRILPGLHARHDGPA